MKYDVIIIGGGTAGCACAYIAGKLGLKTLLIEQNSFLGGTMTSGLVFPAMSMKTDIKKNTVFFETLMNCLHNIGGQVTYSDGNIGWFNPELMKIVLDKMMDDAGVTVLLNSSVEEVVRNNNKILGVTIDGIFNRKSNSNVSIRSNNIINNQDVLLEYIETRYLIDASGDAKIFEKINLKFLNDYEKKYQPTNLRFIMSGINMKEFSEWLIDIDDDRSVTTVYNIDNQIHLSTAYTWDKERKWALSPIFKKGVESGIITEADCNYFQLFSIPGMQSSLGFNCPRILTSLDINDKFLHTKALKEGRESILRLSEFLRKHFKGFENAYISSIANTLGVRVSNRIIGKYIYTIDDLKSGKKFENPVLISKYPIDIHSNDKNSSVLEDQLQEYMLPIESLMSADYDNLFAIGRCISADFEAQSALRIIPSCFAMGEGLAKYLAKKTD